MNDEVHRRTAGSPVGSRSSMKKLEMELAALPESDGDAGVELKPLVARHDNVQSPDAKRAGFQIDDGHGAGAPGSASTAQVIINIIISFVGAGLLGIPHAFSESGWFLGTIALLCVSAMNVYAMLRLPAVQVELQKRYPEESLTSYGEVGRCILGPKGEVFVQACLAISQCGFGTAYIIFIAANVYSMTKIPRLWVCLLCIPGLAMLVQFRSLSHLAPFSLLANASNFAALCSVLLQDYESYVPHNDTIHPVKWGGLLYVMAVTIYSMEGVALILSLQASSKEPARFPVLLIGTVSAISVFMAIFGWAGYVAFGDQTQAPITLNMTANWSTTFVKSALCLGLYLTFPIMMFPIWNILEGWNQRLFRDQAITRICSRALVVFLSASVAYMFPNFGHFLSLVGSSICTLLGFVFPSYFHLKVLGPGLHWLQYGFDIFLLLFGVAFGVMGTIQSVTQMMNGEVEG